MSGIRWRARRGAARLVTAGVAACCVAATGASAAGGQSLLERPPNLWGSWVGSPGTVYFHFLHRFEATDAPTRKVINYPTFLLGAALPAHTMVGARYATNSPLVSGFPNEWEFFGRVSALARERGAAVDVTAHGAYNQAAASWDGEVTVGREVGRFRLLALGRGFSSFRRTEESKWAIGGGATVRLHEFIALAADVATLTDRGDAEDVAWSAGVQLRIPYTPHTLSLQASNASTTTLQGASVGLRGDPIWGFEFTVPFTLSRYFGGRGGVAADAGAAAEPAEGAVVDVGMTNALKYEPATVRIRVGQTVRWRNTSEVIHTVTADPKRAQRPASVKLPEGASPFDSGDIAPGAAFTHTFTVAGEYTYFCVPHELAGMIGRVIVEG